MFVKIFNTFWGKKIFLNWFQLLSHFSSWFRLLSYLSLLLWKIASGCFGCHCSESSDLVYGFHVQICISMVERERDHIWVEEIEGPLSSYTRRNCTSFKSSRIWEWNPHLYCLWWDIWQWAQAKGFAQYVSSNCKVYPFNQYFIQKLMFHFSDYKFYCPSC